MKDIYYGVDFHKNTSTICALYQTGEEAESVVTVQSSNLLKYFSNRKAKIAIEATGGSNHMVEKLRAQGQEVTLVETNQFKVTVNGKKTDERDARVLANALRVSGLPTVHLRSRYSRELKSLLKTRDHIVETRTNFINHIRGTLREYGINLPVGKENFWKTAPQAIQKVESVYIKTSLASLFDNCHQLQIQENEVIVLLKEHTKNDPRVERLKTVKGIGDLVAMSMIAVADEINRFPDSKRFASYLGLVPSVSSSANKTFMGSITKSGSEMARRYLIHGARAWLMKGNGEGDAVYDWAVAVKKRRGVNKAVVALAHRMARICYALLRDESKYEKNYSLSKDIKTVETGASKIKVS